MPKRLIFSSLLLVAVTMLPHTSFAFTFTPTDIEWGRWSNACKAKYVWTLIGQVSKYANTVTRAQKNELAELEKTGIRGLHHYCAGTSWLDRARVEPAGVARDRMLRNALGETQFSYSRSNRSAPFFAYLAIQMATVMNEQGQPAQAIQLLQAAIVDQPRNDVLYSAAGVMLRRLGRLEDAKAMLLQGNEALNGTSPEISYHLGLLYLELGEVDEAEKHAKVAYQLGYPLPGLRRKLQQAGRM